MTTGFFTPPPRRSNSACHRGRFQTARIGLRSRRRSQLRLIINEYHPEGARKSWGDGKNTKLEDKLVDAAPDFAVCAQGKHEQELAWQEQRRRWEEEARLRREQEERERKEKERRETLLEAAKNWRKAEGLQAFRVACEARLRSTSPDGALNQLQAGWLEWVDGVIRDTNPLTAGFLKRLEEPRDQTSVATAPN